MADKEDGKAGAAGWPQFLSELTKSFLILRDIFGYALPGAVFVAMGMVGGQAPVRHIQQLMAGYYPGLSGWAWALIALVASYLAGNIMAQVAYIWWNTWSLPWRRYPYLFSWMVRESRQSKTRHLHLKEADLKRAAEEARTKAEAGVEIIRLRAEHPRLLIELDRQSIIAQMRGTTGVALILGFPLRFIPAHSMGWVALAGGIFLLAIFWFNSAHLGQLAARTAEAGGFLPTNSGPGQPPPAPNA